MQEDLNIACEVVRMFIRAMNGWETHAATLDADSPHELKKRLTAAQDIFLTFCTVRERPYGRNGASYSQPPEYDPNDEKVLDAKIIGSKAEVETARSKGLFDGQRRYILFRKADGWRIDNVKVKYDAGEWEQGIL